MLLKRFFCRPGTRSIWAGITALVSLVIFNSAVADNVNAPIKIGSKSFTESIILGEIAAVLIESQGHATQHLRQLGGTRILWNSLLRGDIDIYPEYTGTLINEIFADKNIPSADSLNEFLAPFSVRMSAPLGFNNTYAISMKQMEAQRRGIKTISDLRDHPDLAVGFSNEFMARKDGWPALRHRYRLPQTNVRGLIHDLAYRGLEAGSIQVIDAYSTDAEIAYYQLQVLTDDLKHFPVYNAVYIYRLDLKNRSPNAIVALTGLSGKIPKNGMIEMNAAAKLKQVPESEVARTFLENVFTLALPEREINSIDRVLKRTREHMMLVVTALVAGIVVALPLGIVAARIKAAGHVILTVTAIIQTIPALALLVFMIPLLGIGAKPAIFALFLYSLLPMVRNTCSGLQNIPQELTDSADALGLSPWAKLRLIELPLAFRPILAGIKTSTVITVGYATLGALIGAGGYGQPILAGIRLDNLELILEGAVPAAILALTVQGVFELLERYVASKGLRL